MAFHARCEKCGAYDRAGPGHVSFPVPQLPEGWHRLFMQDDSPNVTVEPQYAAVVCKPCSMDLWNSIEVQLRFRDRALAKGPSR